MQIRLRIFCLHYWVKKQACLVVQLRRWEENDGKYKIRGLKTGVYKIKFFGHNGYFDTTISNINVQRDRETEIQNITLHN